MAYTGYPFFDIPATRVEHEIDAMARRADDALIATTQVIEALSAIELFAADPAPANFAIPEIKIPSAIEPTGPATTNFGTLTPWVDPPFEDVGAAEGVDDSLLIDPGTFESVVGTPQFPPQPGPIDISGEPTAPTITEPVQPAPPTLVEPVPPVLIQLQVPEFPGITPPVINDVEPDFIGVPPSGLDYTEEVYSSDLLEVLTTQILQMLAGGTGLPPEIQQALFDAARAREEDTALAAEQEAFDTWAARGFSMPPGMLVESVTAAQERSRFNSNALSRDILTKAAQWEIENLRFAVSQGIALETLLMQQFNQIANRTLEAAKIQVELEIKVLDVAVALYNAQQSARMIAATIYKTQWEGQIAIITAYKAQVDAVIAMGQLNEQNVKVYLGMWEGVKTEAEVYRTMMQGAQISAGINQDRISAYAAETNAYVATLNARKVPTDQWAEIMRGESLKSQAMQAEVQAFAETVRSQEIEANVKMKYIDLKITSVRASVEKYQARLQAQRDHVAAELSGITAVKDGFVADTGRYAVELQGANQARSQEIQVAEMRLRNDLAYYETQLKEFDAALDRQLKRVALIIDSLKSAGTIGASLASGAMSAIHVQAAMSGSGSTGVTTSYSHTFPEGT